MASYVEIPGEQYDERWYAESKGRLGCSQIAAAVGKSCWQTSEQCLQAILHPEQIPPKSPRTVARMQRGLDEEPRMRTIIDTRDFLPTGCIGREANLFLFPNIHPKLKYSPDYLATRRREDGSEEIVKLYEFKFRQSPPTYTPIEHTLQIQFAMYFMNVPTCGYLVGWEEDGQRKYRYIEYTLDNELILENISQLHAFLEQLE